MNSGLPEMCVGFDLLYFFDDFLIAFIDLMMLNFILPFKSVYLMLVMQLINAMIISNIFVKLLRLAIGYLFDFSQMLHVELIPHFIGNYIYCGRVDHESFHDFS